MSTYNNFTKENLYNCNYFLINKIYDLLKLRIKIYSKINYYLENNNIGFNKYIYGIEENYINIDKNVYCSLTNDINYYNIFINNELIDYGLNNIIDNIINYNDDNNIKDYFIDKDDENYNNYTNKQFIVYYMYNNYYDISYLIHLYFKFKNLTIEEFKNELFDINEIYCIDNFKNKYNNSFINLIKDIKNNINEFNEFVYNEKIKELNNSLDKYYNFKHSLINKYNNLDIINFILNIIYCMLNNNNILYLYLSIDYNKLNIKNIINLINNSLNKIKKELNIKNKLKVILTINGLYLNDNDINLINDNIIIIQHDNYNLNKYYNININSYNDYLNEINNIKNYNNSLKEFHKYQDDFYKKYLLSNYEEYKKIYNELTKDEYEIIKNIINKGTIINKINYKINFKINKLIKNSNKINYYKENITFEYNISFEIINYLNNLLLNNENKKKLLNVNFINIEENNNIYNIDIQFNIFTSINKENYIKKLTNIFNDYYKDYSECLKHIEYKFNILNIINGTFN